jgi:hypothetical protein
MAIKFKTILLSGGIILLLAFTPQGDFGQMVQEKLFRYYQAQKPAELHLFFNQPKYAAGDTVFFTIHFSLSAKPTETKGRQIVKILLLHEDGKRLSELKVLVKDGFGYNQIVIPEDAPAGVYTILAFTESMKNSPASYALFVAGETLFEIAVEKASVTFHPEGGHLIAGINNKVVVKGPPNFSGEIVSSTGNPISSYRINEDGIGLFFITPSEGQKYFSDVGGENVELPQPENDGVGILVNVPANQSPIRVTLQAPAASSLRKQGLHLVLSAHDRVFYTAEVAFGEKKFVTFSLPQDSLKYGIAQLTIFQKDGSVVAERLLLAGKMSPPLLNITLPQKDMAVREQVNLKINVADEKGKPLESQFAITVYNESLMQIENGNSQRLKDADFAHSSFLSYHKSSAALSALKHPASVDLLLITETWQTFKWPDVWDERLPEQHFQNHLQLAGTLILTDGGTIRDSTRITFFLQESVMTYETYVDESGKFDFPLIIDFMGREEVFFKVDNRGKVLPNVQIQVNDNQMHRPVRTVIEKKSTTDALWAYAKNKNVVDRSYAFREKNRREQPRSLNALIEEEIFGADLTINLDDYLLFPTMSETLREIIPMLQHRKQRNRDMVRLFFDDENVFADDEPLYIIDGVITDNTTYFLALKPAEVASVKIIHRASKLRTFGTIGSNGIVLVETKLPQNSSAVPRSDHTFVFQGLSEASRSHQSDPMVKHTRVPDFRTTVYWRPQERTTTSGEVSISFPASNDTGNFRIRIDGFTADGRPFSGSESFTVSFKGH